MPSGTGGRAARLHMVAASEHLAGTATYGATTTMVCRPAWLQWVGHGPRPTTRVSAPLRTVGSPGAAGAVAHLRTAHAPQPHARAARTPVRSPAQHTARTRPLLVSALPAPMSTATRTQRQCLPGMGRCPQHTPCSARHMLLPQSWGHTRACERVRRPTAVARSQTLLLRRRRAACADGRDSCGGAEVAEGATCVRAAPYTR